MLQWQNHNKRRLNTNRKLITFEDYLVRRVGKCDDVQETVQEVIHTVSVPKPIVPDQNNFIKKKRVKSLESKVNRCRYTYEDLEFFQEKCPLSQKLYDSVRKYRMSVYLYMNNLLKNTPYEGVKGIRQFSEEYLRK